MENLNYYKKVNENEVVVKVIKVKEDGTGRVTELKKETNVENANELIKIEGGYENIKKGMYYYHRKQLLTGKAKK